LACEADAVPPCQRCQQRAATRRYFDTMGNEVDLCEACAAEPEGHSGRGAFSGFAVSQKMLLPVLITPMHPVQQACPSCGTTLKDLRQSSLLGCADCYRFFREPLLGTLRQLHGAVTHQGRGPCAAPRQPGQLRPSLEDQLKGLRDTLERAVVDERYEDAAKARDQIRAIQFPPVAEGPR
jgi:protein arginine kinase activator